MLKKLKAYSASNTIELVFFTSIMSATAGFAFGGPIGLGVAFASLMSAAVAMMIGLLPQRPTQQPKDKPTSGASYKRDWKSFAAVTKKLIKELWKKRAKELVVENEAAKLTGEHMARFKDNTWLSDENINFYLHMLPNQSADQRPVKKMSSFFFAQLTNPKKGISFVRNWMKNITLEGQLLVPVNTNNSHWCLGVID